MNNFRKTSISLGKIIILVFLALLLVKAFLSEDIIQLTIGFFILIFIALPTIFLFYFKKYILNKYPKMIIIWKIVRFIYILSVIFVIIMMVWGYFRLEVKEKTQNIIDFINSKKITMDDVLGVNLPPMPDKSINDSTVAGIDVNGNYIRDDVELAIFEKYPESTKIRAAQLQYAQALQLELTQVINKETYVSIMQKEDLAYFCLGLSSEDRSLSTLEKSEKVVMDMVINNDLRVEKKKSNFDNYMTGYSLPPVDGCDIKDISL
ncbi:MAG: hypothetical protein PHD05_06155 [Sphaerochaetaceae bacterium]|nr:hypothetical protein [Sphaerochaetaceae bacterium]